MDHVNVNRVSLTALGAVLFVMLLTAFSNLVLSPRTPKTPGFALPTSGPATEAAAGPAEPEAPPLPALLAKADAAKGAQYAKVCQTCHNFEKGAAAKIGPPLWGVVGRPIASIPGFAYSDSLKGVGGNWTYEALNVMVSNPKKEASGTKMTFPGEKDPQRRADILAYLQTLSDSPVPFPK
jgi:cytochrome c